MSSIFQDTVDKLDGLRHGRTPEVDGWFLMGSPLIILGILITYLLFVLKIGPAMMKHREPFQLRRGMMCYNAIQVVLAAYIIYKFLKVDFPLTPEFFTGCSYTNPSASKSNNALLFSAAWFYILAKLTELFDTVFFVLRKRSSQISFLHVYHHSAIVLFSWSYLKYAPDVQGAMVGLVNSFVHVFMYSYYLLAAMGPIYSHFFWMKRYITVLQLVQFCLLIAYTCAMAVSDCGIEKSVTIFFMVNSLIFLVLFIDFYLKAYSKNVDVRKYDLNFKRP